MPENTHISYDPLFDELKKRNLPLVRLVQKAGLSSRTVAKFKRNEYVNIRSIETICRYLNVPIENVITIKRNDDVTNNKMRIN